MAVSGYRNGRFGEGKMQALVKMASNQFANSNPSKILRIVEVNSASDFSKRFAGACKNGVT